MKKKISRILLAGTNSGCGKTTVVCAILQALVNQNLKVGAFKCGPDYIDPMFHSRVIGAKSGNLDMFFLGENTLKYLLTQNAEDCDISVIEGVMGYYDGLGLTGTKSSTYEVALATNTPTVLIADAKGASLSVLATIKGFAEFRDNSGIKGVILNRCSKMTYTALAAAIEEYFHGEIKPLGYLPQVPESSLESRHLGLVTASEVQDLKEKMQRLAEAAEESLDLDGLKEMALKAPTLEYQPVTIKPFDEKVRIGVARDKAFCFYYEDSLEALRKAGAELVEFSPLEDEKLPENIQGLYLGGGYPELYKEKLNQNRSMLESIRNALKGKLPCIAECGGFMYLLENIEGTEMVGSLKGGCYNKGKLTRFGYITLTAKKDNMLCNKGESIRAHEFHHYDAEVSGEDFNAKKENGRQWNAVIATESLYAGYPHFHFYSNINFVDNFYKACIKEKKNV